MNRKEYSFIYIRYKLSNLLLIPVCFCVLVLADCFDQMDNNMIKAVYNIAAVFILILLYNRISNYIFQRNGKADIVDLKQVRFMLGTKITKIYISDIEKVMLSINKQFNSKHIELTIKTTENNKIKLVSKRYFDEEDLSNHAFINIFYDIKRANLGLCFESALDGTFLTLEHFSNTL